MCSKSLAKSQGRGNWQLQAIALAFGYLHLCFERLQNGAQTCALATSVCMKTDQYLLTRHITVKVRVSQAWHPGLKYSRQSCRLFHHFWLVPELLSYKCLLSKSESFKASKCTRPMCCLCRPRRGTHRRHGGPTCHGSASLSWEGRVSLSCGPQFAQWQHVCKMASWLCSRSTLSSSWTSAKQIWYESKLPDASLLAAKLLICFMLCMRLTTDGSVTLHRGSSNTGKLRTLFRRWCPTLQRSEKQLGLLACFNVKLSVCMLIVIEHDLSWIKLQRLKSYSLRGPVYTLESKAGIK